MVILAHLQSLPLPLPRPSPCFLVGCHPIPSRPYLGSSVPSLPHSSCTSGPWQHLAGSTPLLPQMVYFKSETDGDTDFFKGRP
ncbi:hypothetical protein Y1Q_0021479 [Alligator mississippiensis]|uniref:Uncharacterized protein n=1 Tax=Alligator mississippiensis TaxID=8496 RepID=A0A151P9R9_ALLMI|nr:hypothetical protein Y1Q_0021479 [Alligator mississippiensis]